MNNGTSSTHPSTTSTPAASRPGPPLSRGQRSALAAGALRAALQDLVDRHPVLRTTYAAPAGEPAQVIRAHMPAALELVGASRANFLHALAMH